MELCLGHVKAKHRKTCRASLEGFRRALRASAILVDTYVQSLKEDRETQMQMKTLNPVTKRRRIPEVVKVNAVEEPTNNGKARAGRGSVMSQASVQSSQIGKWERVEGLSALNAAQRHFGTFGKKIVTRQQKDGASLGHPGRDCYIESVRLPDGKMVMSALAVHSDEYPLDPGPLVLGVTEF